MDIKFEGIITLESSLSHISESIGTDTILRREKLIQPNGAVEEVFVYSGNAFRGMLRDCGMRYFLQKIGAEKVALDLYYFLFSGGALVKGGRGLTIDQVLGLRKLIPLISIFGGAWGNQILPGKFKCGKAYPVAEECRRQIASRYHELIAGSWRQWIQSEEYTRKDDAKDPRLSEWINKESIAASQNENPQQMRYSIETIAAGARLFHRMELEDVNDLELGAFVSCLTEFSKFPYLGGMSRAGHGRCTVDYERFGIGEQIWMDEKLRESKEEYDEFLDQYQKHLAEKGNVIKGVLAGEV